MSREHKYRAWDVKRNIMIYDGDTYTPPISVYPAQPVQVKNDCIIYPYRAKEDGWVCVHDKDGHAEDYYRSWDYDKILTEGFIFEEFTGKRDSKRTPEFPEGQEIYEGDKDKDGGVVLWNEDDASFVVEYENVETQSMEGAENWFSISGNIHSQKEEGEKP